MTFKVWAIAFNALNALDAALTFVALRYMGFIEFNPIMRWLIDTSPLGALAVKLSIGAIATYSAYRVKQVRIVRAGAILFFFVCLWNSSLMTYRLALRPAVENVKR